MKSEILPMDGAPGIRWNVVHDMINVVVSNKEQPDNWKGVLSLVATVYDPFFRLKFDWDRNLPDQLRSRWKTWREGLASLESFSVLRCYN